jgi:hypothetical protein
MAIPTDLPRTALDFNQKKAIAAHDQKVDFVDAAVTSDKFEVAVGAEWFPVGKRRANVVERLLFPGKPAR